MINYKVNEAKFLADYLAIEESRSEKVLEAEKILVELGDRIKRLKPETVAQIKSDIYSDIDKEICEQKSFYDKYIVVEEVSEELQINENKMTPSYRADLLNFSETGAPTYSCESTGIISTDNCIADSVDDTKFESVQIDEPLVCEAVQTYTEPTEPISVETTITDTADITINPTI